MKVELLFNYKKKFRLKSWNIQFLRKSLKQHKKSVFLIHHLPLPTFIFDKQFLIEKVISKTKID